MTQATRTKLPACCFLACCLLLLPSARGDSKPDSAAGAFIAIGGTAPERDRDVVGAAVATAARSAGWRLLPKALAKVEADALIHCATPAHPWECMPASVRSQSIHHALIVSVEPRESDTGVPMLLLVGKAFATSPATLVSHQRFCVHCADDKLAEASTELTAQLLNELASRSGRTLLEVNSTPANAIVSIDGQPTGGTNDTFNTFPGPHVVKIEKPGFLPETVHVTAEEGKTAKVAITLHQTAAATSDTTSPDRAIPWIPVGLIGSGAVLVAGGALIYADQQDGPDDKFRHPRATAIGVSVGIAGLAAIGTGVYLWWRGSSTPTGPAAKTSTPTLNISPGGASVGWTRTF